MSPGHHPNPFAAAAAPRPQPTPPRRSHRVLLALELLLATALALLLALWWWAGSSGSLASTLSRATHYLPEGQSLETREVTGSLRAGGRIGWLRWSSPTLAVEVRDATLGWRLRPLLQRTLQLGELSAASVQLTPLGPPSTEPPQPLAGLELPLRITLPALRIDELTWAAATPVVLRHIEASYRYDGRQHHATLARLELAQGRYSANATLDGTAPMQLDATLQGQIDTTHPAHTDEALRIAAQARIQGRLDGPMRCCRCRPNCSPTPAPPRCPACAPACWPASPPGRRSRCTRPRATWPT